MDRNAFLELNILVCFAVRTDVKIRRKSLNCIVSAEGIYRAKGKLFKPFSERLEYLMSYIKR